MKSDRIYLQHYKNGCLPLPPIEITEVFTLFLRCCQAPFVFFGELHEPWELVYVRKGAATITADDRVLHLSAGSLIFHKPMDFHQIFSEQPGLEIFVASFHMSGESAYKFRNSAFQLLPAEQQLLETLIARCVALNNGCFHACDDRDCKPLWQTSPLEFYTCVHQLEHLFCLLLMRCPSLQPPQDAAGSILYKKIVSVLEEHLYGTITIPQVAALCDVSPSSIKTCFRRHAGCGLHKYFLKIKLREAVRLIKEGRSISSVSDTLGFNNPNYFSYVFQREMGRKPTDYKKS